MIECRGLSKSFTSKNGEIDAIRNVSFKINDGEFVSIMGKSGAGKSTLLNIIGGLEKPDSGCVIIDGEDITALPERKCALLRRRKIGVIYQFYNLIPELDVTENITLPTELDGKDVENDRVSELLLAVGLAHRADAYPETLSGGEQQRVAIARAVYMRPSLILADEPTGNLDEENALQILKLLREMSEKYKITVLMVTHSSSAADASDRVITVENGEIVSDRRRGQ